MSEFSSSLREQIEQLPTDHLREVQASRVAYAHLSLALHQLPEVSIADFSNICDSINADPDKPGSKLSPDQRLAAFEQLQADGILTLASTRNDGETFGVLTYKAPLTPVSYAEGRNHKYEVSRELRRAADGSGKKAKGTDLNVSQLLLGNHTAERFGALRQNVRARLAVGHLSLTGTQKQENSSDSDENSKSVRIDPEVLAWAEARQTRLVFGSGNEANNGQSPLDVESTPARVYLEKDSLIESVRVIYDAYIQGLGNGDLSPQEALQLRVDLAKNRAHELLKLYSPHVPIEVEEALASEILSFYTSRRGEAVIRDYRQVLSDLHAARKRDASSDTERGEHREATKRDTSQRNQRTEKVPQERRTEHAQIVENPSADKEVGGQVADTAYTAVLRHLSGAWAPENFYRPLPRMSEESLANLLRRRDPNLTADNVATTYKELKDNGILDESGNVRDEHTVRTELEALGIHAPERTVFDDFTKEQIDNMYAEITKESRPFLLGDAKLSESNQTEQIQTVIARTYAKYLGVRDIPRSAIPILQRQLSRRLEQLKSQDPKSQE